MNKAQGSFFERVQGKLNPVTVKYYYGSRLEGSRASLPYQVRVLSAHVYMLSEVEVIPGEAARSLLGYLEKLRDIDPAEFPLDPRYEDMYINLEKNLAADLGPDIAGYLPVARSRNDVESTMWRLELREVLARLAKSVLVLAREVADRADECADYLMPGYTYGQQAQPHTAGHYLSAISAELLRDTGRLVEACGRQNYSPLGAAAFAGTGFPISRKLTSELLGFDGLLENTLDAVASADHFMEALTAAAICACTMSRFAEDIFKWCSNEVNFASLGDDLIDSSSIMPQKRNPVIVSTVRAQGRVIAGEVAGLLAACSTNYEASRDVTMAVGNVFAVLKLVEGMSEITRAIVVGLTFNRKVMEEALQIGFANATELADTLAREGKLPFRLAHQVVGNVVAALVAEGKGPGALTYELLDQTCRATTGAALPISEGSVRQALDHRVGVERRGLPGGPAAGEVKRMVVGQLEAVDHLLRKVQAMEERWQKADQELGARIRKLVKGSQTASR